MNTYVGITQKITALIFYRHSDKLLTKLHIVLGRNKWRTYIML